MALRAQARWYDRQGLHPQGPIIDVGGAGSPFWKMINQEVCRVLDPAENQSLAEYLRCGATLASEVYCISVIEHVEDLDQFLYHLGCLVAPGGLLFLTMDYCDDYLDDWPADRYHSNNLRTRIFNAYGVRLAVIPTLLDQHFTLLGETDWRWHGAHVYDYSFASLALVKRT